jgi:hypothetical protein
MRSGEFKVLNKYLAATNTNLIAAESRIRAGYGTRMWRMMR